jgi:hypothetical protein
MPPTPEVPLVSQESFFASRSRRPLDWSSRVGTRWNARQGPTPPEPNHLNVGTRQGRATKFAFRFWIRTRRRLPSPSRLRNASCHGSTRVASLARDWTANSNMQCQFRGKLRRTQREHMFSGLPLMADIARSSRHVSNVPNPDLVNVAHAARAQLPKIGLLKKSGKIAGRYR